MKRANESKVTAAAAAVLSLSSKCFMREVLQYFQLLSARFYLCRVFCEMHKQRPLS
jgi:hypothetical protein